MGKVSPIKPGGATRAVGLRVTPQSLAVLHNASTNRSLYLDREYENMTSIVAPRRVAVPSTTQCDHAQTID